MIDILGNGLGYCGKDGASVQVARRWSPGNTESI